MTDPRAAIANTLQTYISDTLMNGDSIEVDQELLLSGLLDSLGVMSLVAFVEQTFGCAVPFEDVLIENFSSVAVITAYLEQKFAQDG